MTVVSIGAAFHQAVAHHQAGRLAEAEAIYRQILSVHPQHAGALHLLGVVALQVGRNDIAVELIEKAIAIGPALPDFHSNLGAVYRNLGRLEEAVAECRRALELDPKFADAYKNLAAALLVLARPAEAEEASRRAIAIRPSDVGSYNNLGLALRGQQRQGEAIDAYRRAIQIDPHYAEAFNSLGVAHADLDELEEATAAFRQAIALRGNYAEAWSNLAGALADSGLRDEAAAIYRRTLELRPGLPQIRYNYALLLLLRGDFQNGWPHFEIRWELDPMRLSNKYLHSRKWTGEPLQGQRLLVHAEQGLGDMLQFVRYVPLIASRGGQVIVECQPELRPLLESVEGISNIVARGEDTPKFDLHCPVMSLPLVFGTRLETIPCQNPHLRADASKVSWWMRRLEAIPRIQDENHGVGQRRIRVGLVWAGGYHLHTPDGARMDRRRSLCLNQLAPLSGLPDVVFVSLQKENPATQAQSPPEGMHLLDWTEELHDFSDTAALIECLDLVISVDTAVAHLAGAMGKPVWLLNRFDTCWRWLLDREDSPWYPTMRLFRQPRFGDWPSVIRRVTDELARFTGRV
jgi:tetratricopeptide (TPR) repeat protein